MRFFLDTEFNGFGGRLLSVGLVSNQGECLYLVIDPHESTDYDPWVQQNVVPILYDSPTPDKMVSRTEAQHALQTYFGQDQNITIVTDWPDDIKYFSELLITGPGKMIDIPGVKFDMRRVDAYPSPLVQAVQHNAMWDALALRNRVLGIELQTAIRDLYHVIGTLRGGGSTQPSVETTWRTFASALEDKQPYSHQVQLALLTKLEALDWLTPIEVLCGLQWVDTDTLLTLRMSEVLARPSHLRREEVCKATARHVFPAADVELLNAPAEDDLMQPKR